MSTFRRRRIAFAGLCGLSLVLLWAALSALTSGTRSTTPASAAPTGARPHVALQVGHWQHDKLPGELRWVRTSEGGTVFAGTVEWRANLAIALAAKRQLEAKGVAVDLVPATVSPGYRAAAFVSIHADGNADPTVSGFRIAPSARDQSGLAASLTESVARRYAASTGLSRSTILTADMTDYYAFDSRRFHHAVNTATPAAILETGFLTNRADRGVIVEQPQLAARGIANGIIDFLRERARRPFKA